MQMTLSLTPRTHFFVKDGEVFIKLNKMSQFSDKKDYDVVNKISIEDAQKAHEWRGNVIAEYRKNQLNADKSLDERFDEIKRLLQG